MRLVADLGGTNVRFGLVMDGQSDPEQVTRFRNDDFDGFLPALKQYWTDAGRPQVDEVIVAVAGPVTGRTARLTNRDWKIEADRIAQEIGSAQVLLLNDLNALGYAVPMLGPGDVAQIVARDQASGPVQQALVVGIGTGLNVSPVLMAGETVICPVAEYGHTTLPVSIAQRLLMELPGCEAMTTAEECFSGRGFALLRDQWLMKHDADYAGFLSFYGELLSMLTRNLFLTFMPMSGIYFAGSVARETLQEGDASGFADIFTQPFQLSGEMSGDLGAPVSLILDDTAALRGCAVVQPPR